MYSSIAALSRHRIRMINGLTVALGASRNKFREETLDEPSLDGLIYGIIHVNTRMDAHI
jgi:hypothetical protein